MSPTDATATPASPATTRSRSGSADRMALLRARRQLGLRCVILEVRETEIATLIARGLLAPADRNNPVAICRALGLLLDRWLR